MQKGTKKLKSDVRAEKTKDFSLGLAHIVDASSSSLFTLKSEDVILLFDTLPRYNTDKADDFEVNPTTVFGDLFSAVCFLKDKVEKLEKKVSELEEFKKKTETEDVFKKFESLNEHMYAMENNMRCLRESLTE